MPQPVVWASELSRTFDNTIALQDVTFTHLQGRIMAVVGPNGSGKSTLMRILLGLLRPSHGHVHVLGLEPFIHAENLRARVGALVETHKDPGNLSALEALQSAADLDAARAAAPYTTSPRQQSSAARASRIAHLLYRFDLWPERHQRIVDMSRSAREKLMVADALVTQPALLLLDEPLSSLDLDHKLTMLAILREIVREDKASLLFTTNALADAEAIADDLLLLARGQTVIQGTSESLLHDPGLPMLEITGRGFTEEVVSLLQRRPEVCTVTCHPHRLFIRLNRVCDTAPLVSLLVESSADIEEVHKRRWDLHARYHQLLSAASSASTQDIFAST